MNNEIEENAAEIIWVGAFHVNIQTITINFIVKFGGKVLRNP